MTTQAKLNRLIETKSNIRQKIISLGVDVPINTPFKDYPSLIDQLGGAEFLETTTDQDLLQLLDLYRWLGTAEYEDHLYTDEEIQNVHDLLDIINNGEPEKIVDNSPVLVVTSFGETRYFVGDSFSLEGYTIAVLYPDGSKLDVTENCTVSSDVLTIDDEYVLISCVINDIELTVKQPVLVETPPSFIEYLESSGNQYIDIGIPMSTNLTIEIDFAMTATMTGCGIVGGWGDPTNAGALLGINNSKFQFAFGSTWNGSTKTQDMNRHKAYINLNGQCLIDDTVLATTSNITTSLNGNRTIRLFASNGGTGANAKMRLYETKIYRDNELIMHLLPAINPMGVYCVFDKVTKMYRVNAGTGVFIGADYVPQQLEYIESTGTQYIDTGIIASGSSLGWKLKFAWAEIPANASAIIGAFTYGGANGGSFSSLVEENSFCYQYGATSTQENYYFNFRDTNIHTIEANIEAGTMKFDGETILTGCGYSAISNTTVYLFASHRQGQTSFWPEGNKRIYSCEMYENGELVRDFIPVLDANGIACLFDEVTNVYFHNKGTGLFVAGPEITVEEVG